LPSTEHFRIMAYAQITCRECLRDIEATLGANATILYGMGLRHAVPRSMLADANERRDWRIWADALAADRYACFLGVLIQLPSILPPLMLFSDLLEGKGRIDHTRMLDCV